MSLMDEYLAIKGNRELVAPEEIHEWAAANPESNWHGRLEWDDAKAGHAHRLWQIRTLLAIHVKQGSNVREIISLSIDRRDGGYRLLDEVIQSPSLRHILINDALAELVRVRKKHGHLVEFAKVWSDIDELTVTVPTEEAVA